MVLDLDLFRADKGADIEKIKQNQELRFKDVSLIQQVIEADTMWRQYRLKYENFNNLKVTWSQDIANKQQLMHPDGMEALSAGGDATGEIPVINADTINQFEISDLIGMEICMVQQLLTKTDLEIAQYQEKMVAAETLRNNALSEIGNILHPSVPISDNEDDNRVEFEWGDTSTRQPYSHYDLIQMIDGVELEKGRMVAGDRGFFLKGPGVLLQLALCQMAMHMWIAKGYTPIYPPVFIQKKVMQQVAQLAQFEEELYKFTGVGSEEPDKEERFLITTSEQPLAAFHRDQWISDSRLPIRYVGQSTCFRQEVGSQGEDTRGIIRGQQFEMIEQFAITSPHENSSYNMMEELINNSKEFYEKLGIAYRIVNIVSGALNHAASKKLNLEGWFPGSGAFRELVSCSNCLDYQSRNLQIRYGQPTKDENEKTEYVHMLSATACATTRVICAILETYQTETGITVPEALKKYLPTGYPDEIPFINSAPIDSEESAEQKDTQKKDAD